MLGAVLKKKRPVMVVLTFSVQFSEWADTVYSLHALTYT